MNIAIFGASGATGTLLTERCLAARLPRHRSPPQTKNFPLRNRFASSKEAPSIHPRSSRPSKAPTSSSPPSAHAPLSATKMSSLAPSPASSPCSMPLTDQGVRRIIVLGSAGALANSLDKQPAWRRWIVQNIVYNTFLKWPVAEQIAQYNLLSQSDLDWTMVMPPMLTNRPARGHYRIDADALPPQWQPASPAKT